ncbi:MAG TPA: pirin family protein [Chitinophagaceae bacterium]|nr:pirin family protein [Chitinophagaceae bacterium]
MNTQRHVASVMNPPPPHMVGDGFRVHTFFPNGRAMDKHRMSPFYLLDYNARMSFAPRREPRGVGVHPHRGFETVTIAYHGRIAHHDSAGNSGVIGTGDVQWMTAGSGLLHKEYHEQSFSREGGLFQMVQLWVNLPARFKMTPPKYQEITANRLGRVQLADGQGQVEVIAGAYQETAGPASTFTPMHVYNVRLREGASVPLSFPTHYNTGLLVLEGAIRVQDQQAAADQFMLFGNDGEAFTLAATSDAVVLVLSGEPIDEPIAQYGPFLMNTWQEVEQAVEDVNAGKFGYLED